MNEKNQTAFFIMPGNALKSLRDELEISAGENMTEGILFRYGFRCGEGMVQRMDIVKGDIKTLSEIFPPLWAGIGLGKIQVDDVSENGAVFIFQESVEAMSIGRSVRPSCDFTRGYIAGMASTLADKTFICIEEECRAKGDSRCTHRLIHSPGEIKPTVELDAKTDVMYKLEGGTSYLIEEESMEHGYAIFVDYITHGYPGLCITRDYPEKIRKMYNITKTPILWLSNAESEYAIEPVQLGKLYHTIEEFLKKTDRSVVLLCGIEYIITQNNYASALKFLQLVSDQIAIHNSCLVLPISPSTLNEKDLKMIEREMTILNLKK